MDQTSQNGLITGADRMTDPKPAELLPCPLTKRSWRAMWDRCFFRVLDGISDAISDLESKSDSGLASRIASLREQLGNAEQNAPGDTGTIGRLRRQLNEATGIQTTRDTERLDAELARHLLGPPLPPSVAARANFAPSFTPTPTPTSSTKAGAKSAGRPKSARATKKRAKSDTCAGDLPAGVGDERARKSRKPSSARKAVEKTNGIG